MLDLILKIALFASIACAAFSILWMYVRRIANLNYYVVGAKAHIPPVAFILSVIFSILSIYELFIEERAKYYCDDGDDLLFVIVSVICLIRVAYCANTDYISLNSKSTYQKKFCTFVNKKFHQLYGHQEKRNPIITAIAFLLLVCPLIIGCIACGMLVYNDSKILTKDNTDYYEITLTNYTILDVYDNVELDDDDDCLIYCYSPELDDSIPLGSGMEWAEKDGETLTHTDLHGHLHFNHFGRTMDKLMSECDGNTQFHAYGQLLIAHNFSGYVIYYLEDEYGTVYIDRFDEENLSRQKHRLSSILFWGFITVILVSAVYALFYLIYFVKTDENE